MRLLTEPTVYLMGRQHVVGEEVFGFLKDNGFTNWETDTEHDSEYLCETAGRVCYMSFAKPRPGGNAAYLQHIKESGHGSVLEHAVWNLLVTGVSRSLTHELVRHRAGMSPSQLSQRYVDESVAEYVVPPDLQEEVAEARIFLAQKYEAVQDEEQRVWQCFRNWQELFNARASLCAGLHWLHSMYVASDKYKFLSDYLYQKVSKGTDILLPDQKTMVRKYARQAARSVLPNATETKIFLTINARAARNIIEQRGSKHAEPEIRMLAYKIYKVLYLEAPNLFDDYRWVSDDGVTPLDVTTPYRKV